MDVDIANAIKKGWHKTGNIKMRSQDWSSFKKAITGKKLFVFGVGNGLRYFCEKYGRDHHIIGVLDNDRRKHNTEVAQYVYATDQEPEISISEPKIAGIDLLHAYKPEEVVVLITGLRYYQEIADQLEKEGFENYFALLPMEAKKRNKFESENSGDSKEAEVFTEYRNLPLCDNKIIFHTMGTYCDHGKAIAEALLKSERKWDIVWMVDNPSISVPEGIRLVYKKNKEQYLYEMYTAKIWVNDYFLPEYLDKREGQIYIQTKHWSSITLKSFGMPLSRFRNDELGMETCLHNASMMDYVLVGSDFDEMTCREGFAFDGSMMRVGSPRSDVLFRKEESKKKVCTGYSLDINDRFILYAPTFRLKDNTTTCIFPDLQLNFSLLTGSLEDRFGGEWKVLLRLHPNVAVEQYQMELPDNVIGVSDYDDSQELVAASDIVITDFSSIMFEPAFVGKPVFLYAPDRNEFIDGERELLIDYDTLPFPIAESNDELVKKIKGFDKETYDHCVRDFLESYGVHEDGHAAERTAEFISELIFEKGA